MYHKVKLSKNTAKKLIFSKKKIYFEKEIFFIHGIIKIKFGHIKNMLHMIRKIQRHKAISFFI